MAYIVDENDKNVDKLLQENIAQKKEIDILTIVNKQLQNECKQYKEAYERYSSLFIIKIIKRILGR